MSQTDLHQLERARAHELSLDAGRAVAFVAELALVTLIASIWFLTCYAG